MIVTDDKYFDRYVIPHKVELMTDLFESVCGKFVGEGTQRIVYESTGHRGCVIKIEKQTENFGNIMEWELWQTLAHQPDMRKWLAPCINISPNGRWLVQKKATPITDKNKHLIPKEIPFWLTDMKFQNYGFIGKQFVCFDYVSSITSMISNSSNKMKPFKSHLGEK